MGFSYNVHEFSENRTLKNVIQSISLVEKVCLMFFAVMVASIIFISAWSSILLYTGNTQGGGPLGMIVSAVIGIFN